MRDICPTSSYCLTVPEDLSEDYDERVASFWRQGSDLLLQLSTYQRVEGAQCSASERLADRLLRENLADVIADLSVPIVCSEYAAAAGTDDQHVTWLYIYATWPDLTMLMTISGKRKDVLNRDNWAFSAISTIRRQNR